MRGCPFAAATATMASDDGCPFATARGAPGDATTASGTVAASRGAPSRARGDGTDESASSAREWSGLETLVNELVASLRPTELSEARRRAVFEHIKHLAQECFGTAHTLVSAYGSVPLRAYLPDGDIDVCLLGDHRVIDKQQWTTKFRKYIERVENEAPPHEFAVSEISVINAEVKLMKCIVDGMMVDVSANQFGGLASLGFLEETNTYVGRDDLFVRSIILVKAWGFYEGRILGAHHALISTYALETLVLYIINKYHAELTCPLSVLHKFLSVFADFDWESHALTIHGPVALEDIGKPQACLEDGLLDEEFMQSMLSRYGCEYMRALAGTSPAVIKYMNIIDPLLPNNNLGRSVSSGNYRRVRLALRLGAKRLDKLMDCSAAGDDMGVLRGFVGMFGNILRHRRLIYPLPHAPDTPGGCEHADEVSLTPMGMPTRAIASISRSCLVEGTTPGNAHTRSVVDELQPRQLPFDSEVQDEIDANKATDDEVDAVNHWLGNTPSPEHKIERTASQISLSTSERGIHWGRWDIVDDETRAELEERGANGRPSIDLSDDSAKLSTSPPQSVSSDDAGEKTDGGDHNPSPPIPEDATAPGINDIFTGCLDTIREHLMFGVFHHRRAYERAEAARANADQRRSNTRQKGGKAPYNRSRNTSRQTKGNKNNNGSRQQQQQQFQPLPPPPPPPPGAPPPGTIKRAGSGYFSEDQQSTSFENDLEAHFPQVQSLQDEEESNPMPQRPRSPRPSPTFPQAWAGVAKLPPKFGPDSDSNASQASEPVTMASVLKEVEEKLNSEASPPKEAPPSATKPSWGPKGSAPIAVLKANATKPVSERPTTPTPPPATAGATVEDEHSDDSANAPAGAAAKEEKSATTKQKRVRSRKSRTRPLTSEVLECETTFPSLGGTPNSDTSDQTTFDASATKTTTWAAKLA